MILNAALSDYSSFAMPASLKSRYFCAGLIYLAAIFFIVLATKYGLGATVPTGFIDGHFLKASLISGLIAGLFHVSIISAKLSPFWCPRDWPVTVSAFLTIATTVFAIDVSLALFQLDQLSVPRLLGLNEFNALLVCVLATPSAVWTIWCSDYLQQIGSKNAEKLKDPQLIVGTAMIATVALTSFFTVAIVIDRDHAWRHAAYVADMVRLSGHQRALGQRIAVILQELANLPASDRAPMEAALNGVMVEMSAEAAELDRLVSARFDRRLVQELGLFQRLDETARLRKALFDEIAKVKDEIKNGHVVSRRFLTTAESHLKVAEDATMYLQQIETTGTIRAAQSDKLLGFLYPLLLLVVLLAVITPVVRIYRSQFASIQAASTASAITLLNLRTYQTALDEHFSVVVTDRTGRIIEANKKFCHLCGYDDKELLGQTTEVLNSGVHTPEFFSEIWQTIVTGATWQGEICNRAKDGSLYWVNAIVFPVLNEAGIIEKFVSVRTDIDALKRQSNILAAVVSNVPCGIALIDKDKRVIAHNTLYRELWDLPDSLFIDPQPSLEMIVQHNAEKGEYGPGEPDLVAKERLSKVTELKDVVYEWARPNGRVVQVHRTPIDGGGLLTTYIDMTDRKAAELALQRAHAQLSAFVKHAPVSVAMIDNNMRYICHTSRWSMDFSLADNLVGQHHYDVFKDLPERYKTMLHRCLGGAIESSSDDLFERDDGSQHALKWEARPWKLPDESIGGLIMMTEDISERKQVEKTLWRAANVDGLTGLSNRRQFRDSLSALMPVASETGRGFAVGIMDIDKFKEINDILGHDCGDILLAEFANRLASSIGEENIVARLGGDEFAFIIKDAEVKEDVAAELGRLFDAVAVPFELAGSSRRCSISCGVTFFPADANRITNLLKNADLALYSAKANGRARYEFFDQDMRRSMDRSVRIRLEIANALDTNALCLYFQPVTRSDKQAVLGFEALLRWRHPEQGLLPPGAFLEAFEDPHLGAAIGTRVMETAVRQAGAWKKAGVQFGYIAINVTSFDFATGDFADRLEALLAECDVRPQQIMIEVTEGMFLGRGSETVKSGLDKLHQMGTPIALDDFGTGYASLTHIKKFPITCLKIDRSFVHDMETNIYSLSIVKAILQLARSLDLQVIAEGIETMNQQRLLESLGCLNIQGYLIAKPLPAAEAANFVSSRVKKKPQTIRLRSPQLG